MNCCESSCHGWGGYIGGHTCVEPLVAGHTAFVIESLCNRHFEAIEQVRGLSARSLGLAEVDIRDEDTLDRVFNEFRPDAVRLDICLAVAPTLARR